MSNIQLEKSFRVMSTFAYVSIYGPPELVTFDMDYCLAKLNKFEVTYSRFLKNNILDKFNKSSSYFVGSELKELLKICQLYFEKTNHIFDPTILSNLIHEGYNTSKDNGFYDKTLPSNNPLFDRDFSLISINESNLITKPFDLSIDLGGVGKGYMIDKLAKYLSQRYSDFCVNIGGDLYSKGSDHKNGYDSWLIDLEKPTEDFTDTPILRLKDNAVATSGINKRKWEKDHQVKNHIIDPRTKKAVNTDVLCATVISDSAIFSDIMAKTFIILGFEEAKNYCKINNIAAIFMLKNFEIHFTKEASNYVWKN